MCQLATSAGLNVREREQTEMAALCPGVQYGLSSQENFGENKDLVFVKLTDSAYRAIEEYLRLQKQNKHLPRTPTIKFLGNEGQLSFPSSSANNNNNNNSNGTSANNSPSMSSATSTTTFSFSLSPTADMEGPGGSFECVQQRQSLATPRSAGGTLAGLGPITHKMRVHATEDVYEETRKRMTFAEKVHKNKCTREIKPNQTDIGRKVKVKQLQHHHQVQLSSQSAARGGNSGGGSGSTSSGSNSNVNMRRSMAIEQYQTTCAPVDRTAASSTSTAAAAAAISSSTVNNSVANNSPLKHQSGTPYSPSLHNTNNHSNSLNSSATNLYNSGNNGLLDRIGGGGGSSANSIQQRFNGQSLRSNISKPIKQSMNSLLRRPLRERLIQLLALRPFKKIEILERFNKEGLRERNGISSVLKQVATSKDNCYHLNPVMWNDVQEEWPFYTEEEKQVLKRRKPQNLTPPGGSDGGSSTGSGNSPTSTHPGSPPSTSTTTMSTSGRHRVSHLSSNLQLQQPRDRDNRDSSSALGGSGHQMHGAGGAGYRPSATPAAAAAAVMMVGDNGKRQQSLPVDRRDASGMNPRSRQLGVGVGGYGLMGKRHLSDDEDVVDPPDDCGRDGSRKRQCDSSHILSFGVNRDPKTWKPDLTTNLPHQQTSSTYHHHQLQQQHPPNNTFDSLRDNNAPPLTNYHPSRTSSTPKQPTTPPKQTIVTDGHQQTNNSSVNWRNNNTNTSGDNAHAQQKQLLQGKEIAVRVSPDRIDRAQAERSAVVVMVTVVADEYDDYLREYTGIGDLEQRRRYKSDFNAVYDEYKELHGVVESVSRRFQILDERLKGEPTNKTPKYNEIKEQIMREYKQTKSNEQHQNAKRRFEYLHRKLSHIKDLVTQYDQQIQLHEDEQQQQQQQQTTAATTTNSY